MWRNTTDFNTNARHGAGRFSFHEEKETHMQHPAQQLAVLIGRCLAKRWAEKMGKGGRG